MSVLVGLQVSFNSIWKIHFLSVLSVIIKFKVEDDLLPLKKFPVISSDLHQNSVSLFSSQEHMLLVFLCSSMLRPYLAACSITSSGIADINCGLYYLERTEVLVSEKRQCLPWSIWKLHPLTAIYLPSPVNSCGPLSQSYPALLLTMKCDKIFSLVKT